MEHSDISQMLMYFNHFLTFQIYQRFDAESIEDVDDARLAFFSKKVCHIYINMSTGPVCQLCEAFMVSLPQCHTHTRDSVYVYTHTISKIIGLINHSTDCGP